MHDASDEERDPLDASFSGERLWMRPRPAGGPARRVAHATDGRSVIQHTPDGRYIVINGRRWRATDPDIPEDVCERLRSSLMAARRAVAAALRAQDAPAERTARAAVHRAKVALGERGTPWWEQTPEQRRERWRSGLDSEE